MSLLKKMVLVAAPLTLGILCVPTVASAQNTQAQNIPFNGTACPTGYERGSARTPSRNNTNICYDRRSDAARSNTNVAKPDRLDRCPLAYFTSDSDPMMCATRLVNPPTIRVKGSGPCRAGEVEDWGIWCVSNYSALTRGEAATALRDWNAIYTLNRATPPRQEDLPEGSEYTPAYITIFGRVRADGSPMAGSSPAAAPAATESATSTQASSQPAQQAQCARATNSGASQAGAALGGLLGSRRGNSQAGAALGGLLGAAAGGARQPGC